MDPRFLHTALPGQHRRMAAVGDDCIATSNGGQKAIVVQKVRRNQIKPMHIGHCGHTQPPGCGPCGWRRHAAAGKDEIRTLSPGKGKRPGHAHRHEAPKRSGRKRNMACPGSQMRGAAMRTRHGHFERLLQFKVDVVVEPLHAPRQWRKVTRYQEYLGHVSRPSTRHEAHDAPRKQSPGIDGLNPRCLYNSAW